MLLGASLLVVLGLFQGICASAQDMNFERGRMKAMLRLVSRDVEKNFYDANLRGLDWKALTDQAENSRL